MFREYINIPNKLAIALLAIIIVLSELGIYSLALDKFGFHIDELFSFGHSNSSNGGFLFPVKVSGLVTDDNDVLHNNWVDPDIFWDYLTVQDYEVFNYSEISINLSDSVHPPLYYFLLHTISSFFPETFSKWLGIIPNMVLFPFVLIALYQISHLLLKSKAISLLVCAVFGFSIEAVNMTIFIRSYFLLTLITTLLVLQITKLLFEEKPRPVRFFFTILLSTLGLLTHYYFYIFLGIITIIVSLYLWLTKQTKTLMSFSGGIILTIAISFFISPNILTHVLSSTRGVETAISAIWALLGLITLGSITAIGLLVYRLIRKKNKALPTIRSAMDQLKLDAKARLINAPKNETLFIILFLTVILTAIMVKLISPGMGVHSDRYYFNLIPLICLIGTMLLFLLMNKYKPDSKALAIVSAFLLISSISSNLFLKSAYVFPPNENRARLNSEIQDSICLLITNDDTKILTFSDVFFRAEKIFAARDISAKSIKNAFAELEGPQNIKLIINNDIPQSPEVVDLLEYQIGYPLQFLYEARHGILLYRVYSVTEN